MPEAVHPFVPQHLRWLLRALLFVLLVNVVLAAADSLLPDAGAWLGPARLAAAIAAIVLMAISVARANVDVFRPLASLRAWISRLREGDFSARPAIALTGHFATLAGDIDTLRGQLRKLHDDLDSEVSRQTERLAQKTASLEILYDVAWMINESRERDELLIRLARTLKEMVGAHAVSVWLRTESGKMRMLGGLGLRPDIDEASRHLSAALCLRGQPLMDGEAFRLVAPVEPDVLWALVNDDIAGTDMIALPMRYHDEIMGVYHLYVTSESLPERDDILELLVSIARQLAVALENAEYMQQAQRLSILNERAALAHELHDSLAQTLVSLRFQMQVLHENLQQGDTSEAMQETDRIRNGIDEANSELRELLANFRAPLSQRGLVPAIDGLASRFRLETGIPCFVQKECEHVSLPAETEMQVLRIIQEALANIRKHSQARAARIILRCNKENEYLVLVEDDGVGIKEDLGKGGPGEHVGLSIMQERARQLGGDLRIESEAGEGTRLELAFHYHGSETMPGGEHDD